MATDNSTAIEKPRTARDIAVELGILFEALYAHGCRLTETVDDADVALLPKLIAEKGSRLSEELESAIGDLERKNEVVEISGREADPAFQRFMTATQVAALPLWKRSQNELKEVAALHEPTPETAEVLEIWSELSMAQRGIVLDVARRVLGAARRGRDR